MPEHDEEFWERPDRTRRDDRRTGRRGGESGETAAARRLARLTPWSTPAVPAPEAPPEQIPPASPPRPGHPPAPPPDAWQPPPQPGPYGQTFDGPYGEMRGDAYNDVHGDVDDDVHDDADGFDDDEDLSQRRGCTRLAIGMGVVAAVLCAVLLVSGFWVARKINPSGSPGDPVTVELVSGQSTDEIAQILEDHGVITDARVFTVYAWVRGSGDIQAGTYELRTNMAMGDVMSALTDGPEDEPLAEGQPVTIPEGLTVTDTITRLVDPDDGVSHFDADTLEALVADGSVRSRYLPDDQQNIEGILFPETYSVLEGVTELEFLERMVAEFERTVGDLGIEARASQLDLSPYEVVIVASMIEKETRIDEERPMVARVIYNRLDDGMHLQIDATSCYEIDEDPCRLSTADLERDSPYNTRIRPGLPPTPIASPGRASLEAALEPADGDWFYYVRNDDQGGHLFTADEAEFFRARQTCIDEGWGCG